MNGSLVVVGAGPAGIRAALIARRSGLEVQLVDAAEDIGGQLHRIYSALAEHAGPNGEPASRHSNGEAYLGGLRAELADAKIFPELRTRIVGLTGRLGGIALRRASGSSIPAAAVLVATGLRVRRLGVPGEKELEGRGVSTSATRDRGKFAGRPVAVVGGGDAAFENALLLAGVGSAVTLVVRGSPRARPEFQRRVEAEPGIQRLDRTRVEAILGDRWVRGIRVTTADGSREIEAEGVFVKVGAVPNTEWCRDAVETDEGGFIRVDARCRASREGVWAAGDVTRPRAFTLAEAEAHAATAIASIRESL